MRVRVDVVPHAEVERELVTTQPANRFRVIAYWCSVSDSEWYTHRVTEASGAVFQVEASFQTGKSDSMLAGTGWAVASMTPLQRRHQMNRLWNRRYSPPNFTS